MAFLLRILATVMNALCDFLFYFDSKDKLVNLEVVSQKANSANNFLLMFIVLGIVCSLPIYYYSCKNIRAEKHNLIACDYFVALFLEFGAVVCCLIVFSSISNGSVSLLVSVLLSYAMSGFVMAYDAEDLFNYARKREF